DQECADRYQGTTLFWRWRWRTMGNPIVTSYLLQLQAEMERVNSCLAAYCLPIGWRQQPKSPTDLRSCFGLPKGSPQLFSQQIADEAARFPLRKAGTTLANAAPSAPILTESEDQRNTHALDSVRRKDQSG